MRIQETRRTRRWEKTAESKFCHFYWWPDIISVITFRRIRSAVVCGTEEKCIQILVEKTEGKTHLGKKLCAILKNILQKQDSTMRISVICSEFGAIKDFCQHHNKTSDSIKFVRFLNAQQLLSSQEGMFHLTGYTEATGMNPNDGGDDTLKQSPFLFTAFVPLRFFSCSTKRLKLLHYRPGEAQKVPAG